ncbi:defensin-A4-like [Ornithorhynchus anatinus]|uniref:defensin-A4-like n=1 Tax=Ornithorhynchus anatinus TaxID=9258 RepID=UPI0010A7D536|nr:defensin-A4-like [Ornithorhynchus anatinus]
MKILYLLSSVLCLVSWTLVQGAEVREEFLVQNGQVDMARVPGADQLSLNTDAPQSFVLKTPYLGVHEARSCFCRCKPNCLGPEAQMGTCNSNRRLCCRC